MARKRVWLSWLPNAADVSQVPALTKTLGKAGLAVEGAVWQRDLSQVGWSQTSRRLLDGEPVDLWLIAGNQADFADQSVRYGLSLAQSALHQNASRPLTTVVAGLDFAPQSDGLPTLLRTVPILSPPNAAWGPQLIAIALRRRPPRPADYRLNVIANPALGQWFEVGPPAGAWWQGAIFGVDSGEITHQGVGPSGQLPSRCVLEYPCRGIQVNASGRDFTCWSSRNTLDGGQSYYVRVVGNPDRILFGALPEQDEAELWVLDLI